MSATAPVTRTRPSKGEQTREMILERAARLFNEKGYVGASLSDIMEVTGLKKGGLYNHFSSKEQLAVEAFNYSLKVIARKLREALEGKHTAVERLNGVLEFYRGYMDDAPVPGGCPVMNTAIESDDSNPELRARAREAMDWLRDFVRRTAAKGVERGELKADTNPEQVTTLILSAVYGALMVSKLYSNGVHLDRAMSHMREYIDSLRV